MLIVEISIPIHKIRQCHVRNLLITLCAIAFFASSQSFAATSVSFVPAGLNPGDTYQIAFVTDSIRDALNPNIADYNSYVNAEANDIGSITENWNIDWFAIASTAAMHARNNAVVTGPVYRIDGTLLANDFTDMWDGNLASPILLTQFGFVGPATTAPIAWTGSEADGFAASPIGPGSPTVGFFGSNDPLWMNASALPSGGPLPFYALSETLVVVPEPTIGVVMTILGAVGMTRRRKRSSDV
jgi:hypothetical protein